MDSINNTEEMKDLTHILDDLQEFWNNLESDYKRTLNYE